MQRIIDVIFTGCVFLLIISLVIAGDYKKSNKDFIGATNAGISEAVEFSQDPLNTGESARSSNRADFLPIIEARIKREIATNIEVTTTKGREVKRRSKKERERERDRSRVKSPERYGDEKIKARKREPLTRHARRPQRERNRRPAHKLETVTNRTRSRQRISHERRNIEKQYLVRNRTLDLLENKIKRFNENSSFIPRPVNNRRINDAAIEPSITQEKIGQILGDADRGGSSIRISDLLLPKTFFKTATKPNDFDEKMTESMKELKTNFSDTLGKLRSIAMNVSKINKAVLNFRTNKTNVEISAGPTDSDDDKSYGYDYENVFEDPSVSPWVNPPRSNGAVHPAGREDQEYFLDKSLLSSVYMPIENQITLHQGLADLLATFFQTLGNATDEDNRELLEDLDFDNSVQDDLCQKWLDCKEKLEEAFLGELVLPACPCHYPSSIFYDDKIWDEVQRRHFRWRDVSGEAERLDVYKPGATYCIRSLLAQGGAGGSAAAQHCCYDARRRLVTRGSGAGTPNYVSPEVSHVLHERIDILPWRLCKGDFSRFNKVRQPNNDNLCKINPDDDEYRRQIDTTKHY